MIRRHFLAGVVGLKAMCAAAALMVGVGQAEAATVSYDVNFHLRLAEETVWEEFDGPFTRTEFDEYWGVGVGDTARGILVVQEIAETYGRAILTVGDTTIFDYTGDASRFGINIDHIFGVSWNYISLFWSNGSGSLVRTFAGDLYSLQVEADLTLDPAPVPLPATAALLPVGIGALAVMRKRRKA